MQGIAQKVMADPGKYSLAQLQQAVENGVIPAYIGIPLIQEKVQQQKQMQMAQQSQAAPAQGPTIAQQVMQEAQGVDALPTGLPQNYAGGGIVAFADGGRTYETPYDRMNRLNREQEERDRLEREAQAQAQGIMPYGQQMSNLGSALVNAPITAFKTLVSAPGYGFNRERPAAAPVGIDKDLGPVPGTSGSTSILGGAPSAGIAASPAANLGTGLRAGAAGTGIAGVGGKPVLKLPEGPTYGQMAQDYFKQYGTEATARDAETEAKKEAARSKVKGDAFEDYKKSLEQEALESGAEKDQAKYMSLFKAGLAMMAGTSRHALENIGKGAMVGAEDYQKATADLKKADKERQKELAHIEQARRAEAIGDRDTAIREADAARDRADSRSRYVGEGIYKATGMDKAQAFELAKTQFASDSDIFRTNLAGQYQLGAARETAGARLAAALARGSAGMTPAQMATLRMNAMKQVDENQIRAQVAKQRGLKKAPAAGIDATFDKRVTAAYDQAISAIINRATGQGAPGGGGNPFAGFRLIPDED